MSFSDDAVADRRAVLLDRPAVARRAACGPAGCAGAIRIAGTVYDGAGEPVPDHLIETWQADPEGRFADLCGYGEPPGCRAFAASRAAAWRTATGPMS